ncbi:MAG: flagellar hook-associated protein FlgK [Acidobacteriaceae bacterium]
MATLNTAFNIATGALDADQAALNVVSNNVANANTPGYTRQVANFEENDPVTINGQSYGMGVTMTGGVSQRDLVLQQALQQQGQVASASSARLAALQQVESVFSPTTTAESGSSATASSGIAQDMSSFFDSLSSLESSPADTALRQQVLTSASDLAGDFQAASSQLSAQQGSLDLQAGSLITQVNGLTQSLAQLNEEIQSASPNSDAGTLEDQRQQDLQQLSQLVGIHQIPTDSNGLEITTSNGALLVGGNQSFPLSAASVSDSLHIFDSEGNDVTSSLIAGGGQIGGLLTVRDQDVPQMQGALDTLAYNFGTAINAQNEAGSEVNGNPGVAIFNLPGSAAGAAAGISVAITDPSQVAAAASGAGSSDDANLLVMAGLQNQAIIGGDTPSSYYSDFVTTVGSLVSGVSTQNAAQEASVSQLQNQVSSLSSVNLNEEAASLETFEQAYESASKIFTILDQVMAAALNLGVETAYTS